MASVGDAEWWRLIILGGTDFLQGGSAGCKCCSQRRCDVGEVRGEGDESDGRSMENIGDKGALSKEIRVETFMMQTKYCVGPQKLFRS